MKRTQRLLNGLIACVAALAMVYTLAAQAADQNTAKVIRLKGGARYKIGNNEWKQLKLGDIVRPGTVIQTGDKSRVDFLLGEAAAPVAKRVPAEMITYMPTAEQNIVRLWENTLVSVDKLTAISTGADVVTETLLDLKAGHITGEVKKMSAASKFEVKIPNGVAGIRGTIFDISAEGLIKVLSGSVVLVYTGANGTQMTQVIMGNQMYDARTGTLTPLPNTDKTGMEATVTQVQEAAAVVSEPNQVSGNVSQQFISPH
jgi:hypothetical protein